MSLLDRLRYGRAITTRNDHLAVQTDNRGPDEGLPEPPQDPDVVVESEVPDDDEEAAR